MITVRVNVRVRVSNLLGSDYDQGEFTPPYDYMTFPVRPVSPPPLPPRQYM